MGFRIFMFSCGLLIPVLMIVFGGVMLKNPPRKMNDFYGYRTTMSRINQDTWDFAHQVCGKLWWKTGWIMLFLSALIQIPFINHNQDTIAIVGSILMLIQCLCLVISIIPVERALSRNFNSDGSRK